MHGLQGAGSPGMRSSSRLSLFKSSEVSSTARARAEGGGPWGDPPVLTAGGTRTRWAPLSECHTLGVPSPQSALLGVHRGCFCSPPPWHEGSMPRPYCSEKGGGQSLSTKGKNGQQAPEPPVGFSTLPLDTRAGHELPRLGPARTPHGQCTGSGGKGRPSPSWSPVMDRSCPPQLSFAQTPRACR